MWAAHTSSGDREGRTDAERAERDRRAVVARPRSSVDRAVDPGPLPGVRLTSGGYRRSLGRLVVVVVALMLVVPLTASPVTANHTSSPWDFGDAPDGGATGYPSLFATTGSFPTSLDSDGARTDDSLVHLGPTASTEPGALVVNADSDDGVDGLNLVLSGIPSTAELTVTVTPTAGAPQGATYYLNVLVDQDMDGNWGGTGIGNEPEWAVRNHQVTVSGTEPFQVTPPRFAYGNGNRIPDGAWMRVALTSTPVDATDWDGSGEFDDGEIEDHVVAFPEAKGLRTWCQQYHYDFGGGDTLNFWCKIENVGSFDRTGYTATLTRTDPDVTISERIPPTANFPRRGGGLRLPPGGGAGGPTLVCPDPAGAGPGGPVALSLDRGQVMTCHYTATKGDDLPSTWEWRVEIDDPPSVVHDWGVELGYSGQGAVPLTFSDVAPACGTDLVVDVCEEHVSTLVGSVDAVQGIDRFVDPDDTLAVVWTPDGTDAPPNLVVTGFLRSDTADVRFYAPDATPPAADITVRLSPSTGRAILNSASPRETTLQALADGRIVVTFADRARQVAWNAYRLGLLERQQRSFGGVGTTVSIAGTTGTVERYPGYPGVLRVPVTDGAWVLNDLGTASGWVPSTTQRFATLPAGANVQFDRPPGVLVGPSATTTSTRVAPLLLADRSGTRALPNNVPALDGSSKDARQAYVRGAPTTSSTNAGAYTAGTNRLLQGGGGSYAVGIAASTYARQATQATQARQATQGVQRGVGYGSTVATASRGYFATGVR